MTTLKPLWFPPSHTAKAADEKEARLRRLTLLVSTLTEEDQEALHAMACELSPENISCDGMLDAYQIVARRARIAARFAAIAERGGVSDAGMTLDDVEGVSSRLAAWETMSAHEKLAWARPADAGSGQAD